MKKGFLYIALATFFFSTMEIALKLTSSSFQAIQLTFLRFLIGSLILLVPTVREIKKRKIVFSGKDWLFFAGSGFLCVVVSMILFQLSILYAPAGVVAVLFSCNSVFAVIFAFLLLGESIHRHTVFSILLSLAGILVIVNPAHFSGSFAGILMILGAAVTFALYNIIGRTQSGRFGGITITCLSFLFGSLEMLILIFITRTGPVSALMKQAGLSVFVNIPILSGITLHSIAGLIYVGIFVTGLGYVFNLLAIESTGAATASLVFYIKPVLAPLFALLLLGEPITGRMGAGIALILAGSVVSFLPGILQNKAKNSAVLEDADETD